MVDRRNFLWQGAATAAVLAVGGAGLAAGSQKEAPAASKFKLRYAPSIGQFKAHAGDDPLAQVRFAADEGFTAMFDNGLMGRPPAQQESIAREIRDRGMVLGPFVLYADFGKESFVVRDWDVRDMLLKKMRQGVESARQTGAKWALIVPGRYDESLAWEYQTANVVENLRFCMDVCEEAGLVVVLEPLNPRDHPGLFLTRIPQASQIVRAVASPCCRIIDDLYHQQITEGDLIPNIDAAGEDIAAFHIGDNPGRKEPGTGEINFRNIFKHLSQRGFAGVLGMEHGQSLPGKAGERAVIDAYRACDDF
ncbi:MAG TPA: TIM barrel protein [Acidobacteriota bacterium]|nr:TIM barrel protein [Acidobacteriota bacterium]